jgi:hypothetical protein
MRARLQLTHSAVLTRGPAKGPPPYPLALCCCPLFGGPLDEGMGNAELLNPSAVGVKSGRRTSGSMNRPPRLGPLPHHHVKTTPHMHPPVPCRRGIGLCENRSMTGFDVLPPLQFGVLGVRAGGGGGSIGRLAVSPGTLSSDGSKFNQINEGGETRAPC